nr:hypothetical protein [Tanacetum cinerariifolium]
MYMIFDMRQKFNIDPLFSIDPKLVPILPYMSVYKQVFFHTTHQLQPFFLGKKGKRENNLRTWKWNEVIDVDSLPDQVEPSNVPKPKTVEPNVLAYENIPMTPFKRKKKDQIKITGTTRLCRLFDEDSSDQEEDLDEDSSDQEEDLDEDSGDQTEDLYEDLSDQEEDLDEDSGDQTEDLYEDSSDPYVFYDEDSSDLEEYLGLFDESDQEEDLGEDDRDDGWV